MTYKSSRLQSVGQSYHQFTLIRLVEIHELQSVLRELVHEPSGAHIMHLGNEDPENLFCLSFQTLPYSSNGVAHILEHTVLCGSENFPVKDPFFAMNRRSLNTFMNALTGADFTCYPAASQVHKDFYNLLDVYLDAVFRPNLNELSFLQEGHRLEFAIPTDPSTPLEYKGIVYNEMKGAMSSAAARLSEAINESIFPNSTYGYNSGGDPRFIPQLTYEELKEFYKVHYHPSRCLFFFYGNMPLEPHLDFIASHTLNHTTPVPPLPTVPLQPRFKQPLSREFTYPIPPEEDTQDKTMIAFGWLTCPIVEQQDVLALNILEIILMDTDASPLKLALLKSGLCKQANSFIDIELAEIPWGITLKGCNSEDADALEDLVFNTLKEICQQGIPLQMVENAIHQLEIYRSEITGDHAPFGLSLFMRSALLRQHGVAPEEGLRIHSLFDKIRKQALANPNYLTNLIRTYLIDNPHFVRIVMKPDKEQALQEVEAEKKVLEDIKASLTAEQTQQIIQKSLELAKFQKQQEEEDIDILPKVSLNDIPLSSRDYPLIQETVGNLEVFHHNTFTNDIIYADLVFDLPNLTEEDLPFLRLLTVVLTQVGAGERDYIETLSYMQGNTGGIGAGISFNMQAHDYHRVDPTFYLKGKALHRKAPKLFSLMQDFVTNPRLDNLERLKEIILKHYTGLESRLNQSALKYAINLSASSLNVASKMAEDLYGLNYFWKIQAIVRDFDNQAPYILSKLQELQKKIMPLEPAHLVLSCTSEDYDELKGNDFYGLKNLITSPSTPWQVHYPVEKVPDQGRVIASPVAFIGKVFPSVSYTHPDTPALNLAAFIFDNLTLHPRIREQGGAYGGGSVSNPTSGNFYFYSYRDPNIAATLEAFDEAVDVVLRGDFDESDIEEAKFEMIQSLDSPVSPGSRADLAYGWLREGKTQEVRQAFRNRLLELKKEDIIAAVQNIIEPNRKLGTTVVFAGQELLEKENRQLEAEGRAPLVIKGIGAD